jgi:signal transduction histidine kinase
VTIRQRLAMTVFLTGLATALGVVVTVAVAFQRFEHESTWERANAFLGRVVATYDDLLDQHERDPQAFTAMLRNLLLFEPDTQLYLLAADGTVLASTGQARLAPGFKVKVAPVKEAVAVADDRRRAAYVMGDDPEHMSTDTVVAARALSRAVIQPQAGPAGYLYVVCQKPPLPPGQLELFRSSLMSPALLSIAAVVALASGLAAWIIVTVTRPLRVLSDEVARASRDGFEGAALAEADAAPIRGDDEIARLRAGFRTLLARLRAQWDQLRRLDRFRREGVSNLSHDLRSPLTATSACLETLDARWAADPARGADRELLQVALRNTRNAARLVRSLGDLAFLDEPAYRLQLTRMDVGEVLDDIRLRFAGRAAQQGVALDSPHDPGAPVPAAALDIELFERAVANLVDNALKFTPGGGRVSLQARAEGGEVRIDVADTGAGIPPRDMPHLFDRFYQARQGVAPAGGEGGQGLGLAIVKRIAELHGGRLHVASQPGQGTTVSMFLPCEHAPG